MFLNRHPGNGRGDKERSQAGPKDRRYTEDEALSEVNEPNVFNLGLDTSGSMAVYHGPMVDAINFVLQTLKAAREAPDLFVRMFSINYGVAYPLRSIEEAPLLGNGDYRSDGPDTPLYQSLSDHVDWIAEKERVFRQNGYGRYRFVTVVLTDGLNNVGSLTPEHVAAKIKPLIDREVLTLAGMIIADSPKEAQEQHDVYRRLGIPEHLIVQSGTSASELRHKLQLVTQSSLRAESGKPLPAPSAMERRRI